jgi:hypothetical protein
MIPNLNKGLGIFAQVLIAENDNAPISSGVTGVAT